MKSLRLLLFSSITLVMVSNAQTIIQPGDVSGTWTIGGSPYQIQGDITIPSFDILTIEPGVMVEFQGHYKLNVQGRLFAIGTENDTITFTMNDTSGFHNPNIPDGGWAGIRFINVFSMIDSSSISYCKLEYGKAIGYWPDNSGGAICVDGFDNLTISNCLITNNIAGGFDWPGGGGIALWNSNPLISNNTISHNFAQFGGGIQCYESSPLIEGNLLLNNSADGGGGIVCNEYSNPNILNTIIENNTAEGGGGITCWNYSSPILNGVTFRNNTATNWSGGAISSSNGNLQIDNCIFEENNAAFAGGAIQLWCGDTLNITYQLYMTNTLFQNNSGDIGGGTNVGCGDSVKVDVFIDKCSFTNNFARQCGGLLLIGDVKKVDFTLSNSIFSGNEAVEFCAGCTFSECRGTVSNCLFNSNVASTGGGNWGAGGLEVWGNSNVDIMNCTFADNTASYGAGLTVGYGGNATITNCIFWNNSVDQIALDTYDNFGGTLTVNYCDIQGGENSVNVIDPLLSTLYWGVGNKDEDPDFENSANDDYHLQNTSPCIGAAIQSIEINGIMCYCPPFDIEGNQRPNPAGSLPDIGTYESELANPVGVEENETGHPTVYALYQNFPNPFNPITTIIYQIPELGFVTLTVYDVLGMEIETLVKEEKQMGSYAVEFNATRLPSGVYLYRLQAGSYVETRKMILLR